MPRIHEKRVIDTKQIVSDVIKYALLTIGALILFFPFLFPLLAVQARPLPTVFGWDSPGFRAFFCIVPGAKL